MYTIAKTFKFEAAHYLDHLPGWHPCSKIHGHGYKVTFFYRDKDLDSEGFVIETGRLSYIKDWINLNLDHNVINNVIENPTAERIAEFLFNKFKHEKLFKVEVKETDTLTASYEI